MELPRETMRVPANIQDISSLSEEVFSQIVDNALSRICKSGGDSSSFRLPDFKPDATKSTFADLSCVLIEAARHDLDGETFYALLSAAKLSDSRTRKLTDAYVRSKIAIQERLGTIGCNPPHIVDVDWRLDYCVKLDTCNFSAVPAYHVRLMTRDHQRDKRVAFTCTVQQLQELVSKLKDASRHLERLTNI